MPFSGPVTIEKLTPAREPTLLGKMAEMSVSIAGYMGRRAYRQLTRNALRPDSRVMALVATSNNDVIGFVIAIVDMAAYWKSFYLRAPMVTLLIAITRARRRYQHREHHEACELPPEIATQVDSRLHPESWTDSSPQIAKISFIGTCPGYEGRGVAAQLYRACFNVLRQRGVERLDACVDRNNTASLFLHLRTGWELREHGAGGSIFCLKRLTQES